MRLEILQCNENPVIWVHAEAFGYGPSALALTILPSLRKLVTSSGAGARLEYIGQEHSLELNTSPPWDKVYDCDASTAQGQEALKDLYHLHRPAITISIVDEPFVELVSKIESTKLIVIDQLLWSWPSVPQPWKSAIKVIAVDYVGVQERIRQENLRNVALVPPLLPHYKASMTAPRKGTLINLGGLRNPFVPVADNIAYANAVLHVIKAALEVRGDPEDLPLQCLVSQDVRAGIQSEFVSSTTPEHARALLSQCRTAFMTSGRTNIYDAADCGGRVVFLPPTNKTQGQQPQLLKDKLGCSVTRIDWHELNLSMGRVDYDSPGEDACFPLIQSHQDALLGDLQAQDRFIDLIFRSFDLPADNARSLQEIFTTFGRDDGTLVARAIADTDLGFKMLEKQ
ncbi:hypothetical protein BGZ63DRAFT_395346 [Mariannaea sp. PMI_226]|nr:hypothetical protein BGZ63DRAFT_395346 [Mariannaea sp. PMI_226]